MKDNDFNPTEEDLRYVADKIVAIAAESPTIGNAVMDLLSNRSYQRVMIYSSLDESQSDSDKLKKAKAVVKENLNDACCGIFNNRNTEGDYLETIYEEDGLTIDICYGYSYFEVFGLTKEDFDELKRYYDTLNRWED